MVQGVMYHDADGNITAMNPASEKILGYTFDEIRIKSTRVKLGKQYIPMEVCLKKMNIPLWLH